MSIAIDLDPNFAKKLLLDWPPLNPGGRAKWLAVSADVKGAIFEDEFFYSTQKLYMIVFQSNVKYSNAEANKEKTRQEAIEHVGEIDALKTMG
ncbi:hypothetical protein D9757_013443 [Collybiopsis confluens]|uniref:Uncharacterized protein n=1 Tax=Collybiopsis confluens TaxID=2823264 RepID=A0A8H5CPH0_9AGAR|nr:hypothetical protein D9757_013443 [Collybiopsis confluens]